jgi:hypothetical protein
MILSLMFAVVPSIGLAWGGELHQTITKAAVGVLPAWQQHHLGEPELIKEQH